MSPTGMCAIEDEPAPPITIEPELVIAGIVLVRPVWAVETQSLMPYGSSMSTMRATCTVALAMSTSRT
jgi:hypothetical protein